MCGITGITDRAIGNKEKVLREMTKAIIHRGPDDDGFFVDENIALGMRRLSIIDLSQGKQPISTADGKLMIFFNGEIYNYRELKEELVAEGVLFKTESDTEVILKLYERYGADCLMRLRGMFAFAIYNREKQSVFVARDFFGIKPLYYLASGEGGQKKVSAFSSEIKSFFAIPGFVSEVNDSAVYNYLLYQYNPLPQTFFKGVYKLPPGHFMEIDLSSQTAQIKQYWQFEFKDDLSLTEVETRQKVYEVMQDSVSHHMIADVPVGSFLSGGIDSSIIATLMQKERGESKVKTFTVGFDTVSEAPEARDTSDFLKTDHSEILVGRDEYFSALPQAIWHFDEPVADPSALGLYFLSREAAKQVKVVLSGEGADELFGGYNIYLEPYSRKKIGWLPNSILKTLLRLPFNFRGKNYITRASRRIEEWYIGNASIFKEVEAQKIWKGERQEVFSLSKLYDAVGTKSDSVKMQYIDIHTWLVGDILAKADKMTMAHSLELRVPFLDIEVARLAQSLPDSLKWRGSTTKYILREAFKNVLPESTRQRKKLGFPTAIRQWMDREASDIYDTILDNAYIKSRMNRAEIERLIEEHVSRTRDNSRKIYLLLALAIWYNIYIERKLP
jgi:asparagine synthase (glutamine-hydrolysing)